MRDIYTSITNQLHNPYDIEPIPNTKFIIFFQRRRSITKYINKFCESYQVKLKSPTNLTLPHQKLGDRVCTRRLQIYISKATQCIAMGFRQIPADRTAVVNRSTSQQHSVLLLDIHWSNNDTDHPTTTQEVVRPNCHAVCQPSSAHHHHRNQLLSSLSSCPPILVLRSCPQSTCYTSTAASHYGQDVTGE